MRRTLLGLAALLGLLAFTAQAQLSTEKRAPDLKAGIAREAKLKEATVEKMLKALSPAFKEQLRAGRQIELPGIGTFEVVRVGEYKDLVNGRPAIIPARNYIQFVPAEELDTAANDRGAVPARTVEGYEFRVNPDATQGFRTQRPRIQGTRNR